MRAAHARAAAEIFAARNAGSAGSISVARGTSGGGGGGDSGLPPPALVDVSGTGLPSPLPVHVLDLHGLHPSEAADVAEGLVKRISASGAAASGATRAPDGSVWLAFLTGTRHHSQRLGKGGGSIHGALLEALASSSSGAAEVWDPPSGFIAAHGSSGGSRGGQTLSGVVVARCSS